MKKHILSFALAILAVGSIVLSACSGEIEKNVIEPSYSAENTVSVISDTAVDIPHNNSSWQDYLYTPTQIKKASEHYFIQDCWNGRILYSNKLSGDLADWHTLTDEFKGGHSLATDGNLIIADNSNNDQLFVYMYDKDKDCFENSQILNIINRPQYILYDENTELFYALSSYYGEITIMQADDSNKVNIIDTKQINAKIDYARSMSIIDGYLYVPDAFGTIYKIDYLNNFDIAASYKVDDSIAGMNYLCKIDDYYYLTVYTGNNFDKSCPSRLIRSTSIEDITQNRYEDITGEFGFSGTPYFISSFDGKYFITEIDAANAICSFETDGDSIINVEYLFRYDTVSEASAERKKAVVG